MSKKIYFAVFIALVLCSCKTPINLEYDNVYSFQDEYALVKKNGKFGVIDTTLKEIIKPTLDDYIGYDLSPYFFNSWMYGIRNDSLIIYDTAGTILHHYKMESRLTPNLLSDQSFYIDSVHVRSGKEVYFYSGTKDWGCISANGDTVVPFKFEKIKEGLKNTFIGTTGGRRDLTNVVYNLSGDTLYKTYNVPILPWKINNEYLFFYDYNQIIEIFSEDFKSINKLHADNLVVSENFIWIKSDSVWHKYDSTLRSIDGPYQNILKNEFWGAVWKKDKVAIINAKGEFITPFMYNGNVFDYISNSEFIVARTDYEVNILNIKGELIQRFKIKN